MDVQPALGQFASGQSTPGLSLVPAADTGLRVAIVCAEPGERDVTGLTQSLVSRGASVLDWSRLAHDRLSGLADQADVILLITNVVDGTFSSVTREIDVRPAPFVIVLSEAADVIDRILALELGADDLMSADCDARELLARARSLMRRRLELSLLADAKPVMGDAIWTLNEARRILRSPSGASCDLSKGDLDLLGELIDQPDGFLPTGDPGSALSNRIRVSISRLRRRFRKATAESLPLRNVWGSGYRFEGPLRRAGDAPMGLAA